MWHAWYNSFLILQCLKNVFCIALSLEYVFIKINLLWLSITRTVNMFRRDGSIMARKPQELRNPKLFVGFLAEILGLCFVCICRNCCSKWHSSSLPIPSSQEVFHICSFAPRRFLNLLGCFDPPEAQKQRQPLDCAILSLSVVPPIIRSYSCQRYSLSLCKQYLLRSSFS